MTEFRRRFEVKAETVRTEENAWFRDLLNYWRPAGEVPGKPWTKTDRKTTSKHLRVAIRDGYLNLYRAGQSVAKVRLVNGVLEASIHNKYVYDDPQGGQKYVRVSGGHYAQPDGSLARYTPGQAHRWILAANKHAGREKIFVDGLLARKANVIDVEAGIPGQAHRMDLVELEPFGRGWRLVFWEAKLVTNPEARCNEGSPKVVRQLKRYEDWLTGNQDVVRNAYHQTCVALLNLHRQANSLGVATEGELGEGIVAVAAQDAQALCLDCKPRLVIDDTTNNRAFTDKHLQKLKDAGILVEMVKVGPDKALAAGA
jgi:hypothetical protein